MYSNRQIIFILYAIYSHYTMHLHAAVLSSNSHADFCRFHLPVVIQLSNFPQLLWEKFGNCHLIAVFLQKQLFCFGLVSLVPSLVVRKKNPTMHCTYPVPEANKVSEWGTELQRQTLTSGTGRPTHSQKENKC